MNGIRALMKETPRSPLGFSIKKMMVWKAGSRLPPDTKSASALVLDFLVSGEVRQNFLLFISLLVYAFCYSGQNRLRQGPDHAVG